VQTHRHNRNPNTGTFFKCNASWRSEYRGLKSKVPVARTVANRIVNTATEFNRTHHFVNDIIHRQTNITSKEVQHCKLPAVVLSLLTLRGPEVVHDGVGPGRLLLPVLLHSRLYFNRKLRVVRTGRQLYRTGRQLGRPGRQQSGIGEQSQRVGVGRRQAARSHQEPVLGTGLPQGELS